MYWQASVTWTATSPDDSETTADALTDAVADRGGAIGHTTGTDTWDLAATVEAGTLRQAIGVALNVVAAAASAANQTAVVFRGVEVIDDAEADRRMVTPTIPPLVTTTEIAKMLGVSRQRVVQLADEDDSFPPPLATAGRHRLWAESTAAAYAKARDPRPGRRRSA